MFLEHGDAIGIAEKGNQFDRRGLEPGDGDAAEAVRAGKGEAASDHGAGGDDHGLGRSRRRLVDDRRAGALDGAGMDVVGVRLADPQV